jgi:hypothetical protein
MKKYSVLFLALGLFSGSCSNNDDDQVVTPQEPAGKGTINIHFDSRFSQAEDFQVDKLYKNANGDSVSFSQFKYYVSNVELIRAYGSSYLEPDSYHLIQAGNTSAKEEFLVKDIPAGTYSKVRFHLGVDAARNNSTAVQVGDLSADHDMTWDWNTGYIFVYSNGKFLSPATNKREEFLCLLGKDSSYRTITLDFPATAANTVIDAAHNPKMHLHANIFDIFGGSNLVDIKKNTVISSNSDPVLLTKMADNYANMFRIDHIHAH